MYERKLRDWENIKHLCLPTVDTIDKYDKLQDLGLRAAERWLQDHRPRIAVPSLDDIREVHKRAFRGVYPFAGQFRGKDQHVGAGHDPGQSAFYQRIEHELERLADHIRPMVGHRSIDVERAHAITLYHLQFESIHPYQEGNGRTGRLFVQAQHCSLLRREPEPTTDRDSYLRDLRHAQKERDLGPLCKTLTGLSLPSKLRETNYRLELWPAPVEKTTEKGTR